MINTLLGVRKNMTSTYDSRGRRVGATVVAVSSNFVTQVKSIEGKDGYNAVQIGTGTKKSVKKPQLGLGKKLNIEKPIRWFKEVKEEAQDLQPGTEITVTQVFSIGDAVKVTGTSKGKGFQGGMRRHGFHGGSRTHGQSDRMRAPGAIGSGTNPGRVYKGKRMAGHMGSETVTTRNLEVVGIDKVKNLLLIKGAVPGSTNGLVSITKLGRIKGYTPPPEEKPSEEEEAEKAAQEAKAAEQEVGQELVADKVEVSDAAEVTETPKTGEQNAS